MSEIESPTKQAFRIQIPWGLRFSLIWTIFFGAIGLFIQYSKNRVGFIWTEFFTSKYMDWFASFGNFTNPVYYSDMQSVFTSILGSWYYFFYTGGLLALIWGIISWIVHFEISVKKPEFRREEQEPLKTQETNQEKKKSFFAHKVEKEDIEEWLDEAWLLISEGKVTEAQAMYNQIRRYYDPAKDPEKILRLSIVDLYLALLECKK
ncbi:hypothetical protein FJZ17_04240 [Candidatus Pacearchaeota archaeon]|nr:hypothetical protein [Candidatus Pacearchaeota archaeon]